MALLRNAWGLKIFVMLLFQSALSVNMDINHPGISKSFKTQFVGVTEKCAEKTNVSPATFFQLLNHETGTPMHSSEDIKRYLLCIFQDFDLMDENGAYKEDNIRNLLDSLPECSFINSIKENLGKCLKEDSQSTNEKAYKFAKCFYDHKTPHGLSIPIPSAGQKYQD